MLAHNDNAGLNYAGAAFIALNEDEQKKFLAEVERLTHILERAQVLAGDGCEVVPA